MNCERLPARHQLHFGTGPPSSRRAHLESWLEVELKGRFSGRVLPVDDAAANRWGLLAAHVKQKEKPLAVIDGLLAATALHYNLTVVSRNAGDFKKRGSFPFQPLARVVHAKIR
ncbi:MAG TPA: PIN domain-containing protein [Bryobacteraceae bacterium]|nr:PIN domain-containing protein [Bryobacteraceae bacterium]